MKDRRYIYLFKRVGHDRAIVILKHKLGNAERIEKLLHRRFDGSRFTMSKSVRQGKWLQSHIKIGISKDVNRRLQAVNKDFFESGRTEWFAMHFLEQVVVQLFIFWYAYRYWFLAFVIFLIWYGNQ